MNEAHLDSALDLMRRLPPQNCEKHLADLIALAPKLCEDLLSAVDQPLKVARDKDTGREYLLCDYNRDEDSYRSPWTNQYDPPIEDGAVPSDKLRKLEVEANAAFEAYRDMYFEGGVSSVYFWDLEYGFAGVVLIKKETDSVKGVRKGCWDSIHVIEILEKANGRQAHYKLTSTIMLWLQTTASSTGTMNVGGSMTRQSEQDCSLNDQNPHLVNIGKMIEEQESKMRSTLNDVYFGKLDRLWATCERLKRRLNSKTEMSWLGTFGKRSPANETRTTCKLFSVHLDCRLFRTIYVMSKKFVLPVYRDRNCFN